MTRRPACGAHEFSTEARACLGMTGRPVKKHPFRIAGTPACLDAARAIAVLWRTCCDSAGEDTYVLHPRALWCVGKGVAVNSLLSTGLLILVGHHDSPFIFTFRERLEKLAFVRFLLAMLAYAWLCGYSFTASIRQLLAIVSPSAVPLWMTIAGLPFALQLCFMMSKRQSPGAGDNLNGTSMVATIARHFLWEREHGHSLEHTQLILISTDGGEIGQRGAIAYVRSHRPETVERIEAPAVAAVPEIVADYVRMVDKRVH